ncbi:MAG: cadherin-like beta sandwich domain-containing protein [Erysipelotrichaceae bacterium]
MKKLILKVLLVVVFVGLLPVKQVQASSGSISVRSSSSNVVVGNTFSVSVTVSGSKALGSWEYTMDYNSNYVRLVSGNSTVVDYGNGSMRSKTYNYTFKAIASGSASIGVRSYAGYDFSEEAISFSVSRASVNMKTRAEIEAGYSKNNNLGSLSISGFSISPAFSSSTTEYSVEVPIDLEKVTINASAQDRYASISGAGEVTILEGENNIVITCRAENGSEKKYTIKVICKDPNPLIIKHEDKDFQVLRRVSSLGSVEGFVASTVEIEKNVIPALYNEKIKMYLVGLIDVKDGIKGLYIYDVEKKTFSKYQEISSTVNRLIVIDNKDDKLFSEYQVVEVDGIKGYKINDLSNEIVFYALNIVDGEMNYYLYDIGHKMISSYNFQEINYYKYQTKLARKSLNELLLYVYIGGGVAGVIVLLLIVFLIKGNKKNKVMRKKHQKQLDEMQNNDVFGGDIKFENSILDNNESQDMHEELLEESVEDEDVEVGESEIASKEEVVEKIDE